jgi:phage shock protein PspC (stress-responsive transcriptional regulator)
MGRVHDDGFAKTAMFEVFAYVLLWLFIPRAKTSTGPMAETAPTGRRRLFRDPDNMLVAGVAAGLARYCGVTSRIVRAAFLAPVPVMVFLAAMDLAQPQIEDLAKVGTFEVVVYLLLWLFIPLAKTSIDKLKMRGHAVTLATVAQQARDETPQASQSGAIGLTSAIGLSVRTLVLGTVWLTGVLLAAWAVIASIGLTVFLTVVMTNPAIVPFTRKLASAKGMGFKFYPFAVCCYLLAVIPLVLIGTVVVTELQKRRGVQWNRPSTSVYVTSMAVWMVALIAWAWLWASSIRPGDNEWLFSYRQSCQTVSYPATSKSTPHSVFFSEGPGAGQYTVSVDTSDGTITELHCMEW